MLPVGEGPAEVALSARIADRSAVIAVMGLGYVGLPLVDALLGSGFRVIGVDTNVERVDELRAGHPALRHLGADLFHRLASSDRFEATGLDERLGEADIVVVGVPTPLTPARTPDLRHVVQAADAIGRCGKDGQLIILESTVAPGTTRGLFKESIESASVQTDASATRARFVAHAPEREDPGRTTPARRSVPRVVGGVDEPSTRLAALFYSAVCDTVLPVESAEVAEAAKLLENTYRAVNIALVNEMKMVLDPLGIDVRQVIDAASSKPFGFTPFYPGPGTGGHCIPVDPIYFSDFARRHEASTPLIDSAIAVNRSVPAFVVERTVEALAARSRAVAESRILVVGLAYKPDLDDTRESPAFDLIARFEGLGAAVSYHDPYIPHMPDNPHHITPRASVNLDAESIQAVDALVIATAHSSIDWAVVAEHAQLVVDTRGVMRPFSTTLGRRLIRA